MKGWFALHRKVFDCDLFAGEKFSHREAWIYLISRVAQNEKTILVDGKPLTLEPGEFHTSIEKLASAWGWNRKTVARYLSIFENEGMLTQKRTTKGTTLKLTNYGLYDVKNADGWTTKGATERTTERTAERTTERTQTKRIKSEKDKKENNNNTSTEADEIDEAFDKIYAIYPKKVGKTKAKARHRQWLKGRKVNGKTVKLTNAQIWRAVSKYVQSKGDSELRFYKDFNVLLGDCLLDYVEEEQ